MSVWQLSHSTERCRHQCCCSATETAGIWTESSGQELVHPWREWVAEEPPHFDEGFPSDIVRRIIGMGTWRLEGILREDFAFLASEIEGFWRQLFAGELQLYQANEKLRFLDSCNVEDYGDMKVTIETPLPQATDPGYPRMFVESRVYSTEKLHKLHMLLVFRQDGMQALHCAMVPRIEYDLPIFVTYMAGSNGVSIAAADLIPTDNTRRLDPFYSEGLRILQKGSLESNIRVPDWAQRIYSDRCIWMCPQSEEDVTQFIIYAALLAKLYIRSTEVAEKASENKQAEIKMACERFCQMENEHSDLRVLLNKSLGEELTERCLGDLLS